MIRGIALALLGASFLLSACGGGSETPSASPSPSAPPSTSGPANPPPLDTTVSFSATSLALTADTSETEVTNSSIVISVLAKPSAGLFSRITTLSGIAVYEATTVWPVDGHPRLRVVTHPPKSMGAGTYTSILKVEICIDSNCTIQARGSPQEVSVTYVVTGDAKPSTYLNWSGSADNRVLTTSDTQSPTTKLVISVTNLPPTGVHIQRTGGSVLVSSVVQSAFSPLYPRAGEFTADYTIKLKPPAALGSGVFTDTVDLRACFDPACTEEVPGSRRTLYFNLIVTATAGVEYTRRNLDRLPNGATNVVWSEARKALFVVSSEYAAVGAGTGRDPVILMVDPVTGATGGTVTLAGENLRIAKASEDGNYLWVASKTKAMLHRFLLPSLALDLSIPLGSSGQPYLVSSMATVPGQPRALVAALSRSGSHVGTNVYDDGVARPAFIAAAQTFEFARWLLPGDTAGTLFSHSYGPSTPKINDVQRLSVDAGGIQVSSSSPSISGLVAGEPTSIGTRLFSHEGTVLDAMTGEKLGKLPNTSTSAMDAVLADPAHGRVYAWTELGGRRMILSFDATTLKLLACLPIDAYGKAMALWGSEGLALVDGERVTLLSGPFFTTYRGEPTM